MEKNNQLLGNLETEIMEIMWQSGSASVRDVLNKIKRQKKPAYTTVMTVMARLNEKGLLSRKLNSSDAYVYRPVQDKRNFLSTFSRKILSDLFKDCGEDIAVAQFIDLLDGSDAKKSKELKRKLKAIIK